MKLVNSIDYYYILYRDLSVNPNFSLDLQPIITYLSLFVFLVVILLAVYYLYREYIKDRNQRNESPKTIADDPGNLPSQEASILPVGHNKDKTTIEPQIQQQTPTNRKHRTLITCNQKPLSPRALKRDDNLFKKPRGVFGSLETSRQRHTSNKGGQNASWALIIDPPHASPGEMINIYISVTSKVFREQTHVINLTLEGQLLYSDTIHLMGKERVNLRFPFYAGPPGEWTIELNGVSTRLQVLENRSKAD